MLCESVLHAMITYSQLLTFIRRVKIKSQEEKNTTDNERFALFPYEKRRLVSLLIAHVYLANFFFRSFIFRW